MGSCEIRWRGAIIFKSASNTTFCLSFPAYFNLIDTKKRRKKKPMKLPDPSLIEPLIRRVPTARPPIGYVSQTSARPQQLVDPHLPNVTREEALIQIYKSPLRRAPRRTPLRNPKPASLRLRNHISSGFSPATLATQIRQRCTAPSADHPPAHLQLFSHARFRTTDHHSLPTRDNIPPRTPHALTVSRTRYDTAAARDHASSQDFAQTPPPQPQPSPPAPDGGMYTQNPRSQLQSQTHSITSGQSGTSRRCWSDWRNCRKKTRGGMSSTV